MNGTWKDGFTARLRQQGEAHRFMKAPIAVFGALVIAVFNIASYFVRNTKRFGCAMLAVIFFFASSSFSFPPREEDVSFVMGDEWTNLQESYEYAPTNLTFRRKRSLTTMMLSRDMTMRSWMFRWTRLISIRWMIFWRQTK